MQQVPRGPTVDNSNCALLWAQKETGERENTGPGIEMRKDFHFSKSSLRQPNVHTLKKMNLDPYHTPYTKRNSMGVRDVNVKL